jgi:hypothetical protein
MSGPQGGEHDVVVLLGFNPVWTVRLILTFRRNILLSSSRLNRQGWLYSVNYDKLDCGLLQGFGPIIHME